MASASKRPDCYGGGLKIESYLLCKAVSGRDTTPAPVMLLDWTFTGLDVIGLDLDGLDRCFSTIGWIGLMLVNPIGSNCLKGTAGTWLEYITKVVLSRHARACTSCLLAFRPLAIRELHVSRHTSANGVYQFVFRRSSTQRFRQNRALSNQPRLF
jgi:hypothetical protein